MKKDALLPLSSMALCIMIEYTFWKYDCSYNICSESQAYSSHDSLLVFRQVGLIRELQIEMNDMGAVIKVLPHLARPSDRIAKEVLAFVCIMLFNANADVQVGWQRIGT